MSKKIKHKYICSHCDNPAYKVVSSEVAVYTIEDDGSWTNKDIVDVDYEEYWCVECWFEDMLGMKNEDDKK